MLLPNSAGMRGVGNVLDAAVVEEPKVCRLCAGGGSHERTRLGNDRFWTVGVRMGVERPVNYLLKEKAGSTMLELKTFLDSSRLGAALLAGRINS